MIDVYFEVNEKVQKLYHQCFHTSCDICTFGYYTRCPLLDLKDYVNDLYREVTDDKE